MTNSLADIMANKYDEPSEIKAIKSFVKDKYGALVGVEMRGNRIVIAVDSAALASTLRMQLHKLQKEIDTDKKITIRIG